MKTEKGDVLNIEKGIIVHGCNSLGIFGAGIAAQIKSRFPEVFNVYAKHHRTMGSITFLEVSDGKFIVNGITQKSTGKGKQISYDAIEEVFIRAVTLQRTIFNDTGESLPICFPMIGAGLGGGNWAVIQTIIDQTIPRDIDSYLYVL